MKSMGYPAFYQMIQTKARFMTFSTSGMILIGKHGETWWRRSPGLSGKRMPKLRAAVKTAD